MTQANDQPKPAAGSPVEQELGPLPERIAAAGCPPPGWVEPGVVPSPVGRLYTQSELDAAVAAERERWQRVAAAAQAVTNGAEDIGDFLVSSSLMAALALALDEGPNAEFTGPTRRL